MKKGTMRSAALSFLAAAILTGSFAVFYQGNVPVQGMSLDSIINNPSQKNTDESAMQESLDRLSSENSKLIEQNAKLNESLVGLLDKQKDNKEKKESDSSTESQSTESSENVSEKTTVDSSETTQEPAKTESFVINDGDGSEVVAQKLVDQGLIDNTSEFLDIVYQWNLEYVLQTGTFELNSDMSVHDIASILTGGQYYYIP